MVVCGRGRWAEGDGGGVRQRGCKGDSEIRDFGFYFVRIRIDACIYFVIRVKMLTIASKSITNKC